MPGGPKDSAPAKSHPDKSRQEGGATYPTQTPHDDDPDKVNHASSEASSTGGPSAAASTEGQLNEWKHRAPYRVHSNNETFKTRYEGSCHCGKVQFQISRDRPLASKICHCNTCNVLHGAPFQWAAIFHKDDINFTDGHHELGWYDPSEKTCRHKLPCKVRCAYCATPIMDEGRNMILLYPTLLHFKSAADRRKFDPQCHMFYTQRVITVRDGLPKWSGINDESELVPEDEEESDEAADHGRDTRHVQGDSRRKKAQTDDDDNHGKHGAGKEWVQSGTSNAENGTK